MAVDRATVLRQQQLLDQAMQQAGNNPVLAEKLSRNALLQSGLEYMKKKQAEDIAKGGRARELALRQGSFEQRLRNEDQRLAMQREAFAEGQKIRNIGMALNIAATLGAAALPAVSRRMEEDKAPVAMEAMEARKELVGPPALPSDRIEETAEVVEAVAPGGRMPLSPRPPRGAEPIGELPRFDPKDPLASIKLPSGQDLDTMIMNIVNQNMGAI